MATEYKLPYTGAQIAQKLGKVDTLETQISQLSSEKVDKTYVDEQIASVKSEITQQTPLFVNSIEECTDTSKKYVLPDGYIYEYRSIEEEEFTDVLDTVGYTPNKRINSSGVIKDVDPDVCDITGYIPCKAGDIIRIKNMDIPDTYTAGKYWNLVASYDTNKTYIEQTFLALDAVEVAGYLVDAESENGNVTKFTVKASIFGENVAYIIINARNITDDSEVYVNATSTTTKGWVNTGEKYNTTGDTDNTDEVPAYWVSELTAKADTIQQIMETAGSKKSAFLWYTDAHWQSSSRMSPVLLKYLIQHTPINKVNFGGDVVNDPSPYSHDNIKYVYDWRAAIADLPNHHSVFGNHDVNHRTTDVQNIAYSVVLAPEETPYMVVGGDSYYYIDYPSEKTRYLYLSYMTNDHTEMMAEGQFIVDSLMSTPEGWHVVALAHRWWQYSASDTPTVGAVPNFEKDILSVFDAYNARETRSASNYFYTQDFTNGKGRVEFCVGGHIHVDHDFTSDGGIPVIITAADTQQERVPDDTDDCGESGTTTESAVFGIIADYSDSTTTKITVVGVGRGTSRVISGGVVEPDEPDEPVAAKNEIWTSKAADGVSTYVSADGTTTGYALGKRLNSSGVERDSTEDVVSGFIPYNGQDIEVILPNSSLNNGSNYLHIYHSNFTCLNWEADGTVVDGSMHQIGIGWVNNYGVPRVIEGGIQKVTIPAELIHSDAAYIRVSAWVESPNTINDSTFSVKLLNGVQ